MSKGRTGSLGYQMMKALQGIFEPGASRHAAKRTRQDARLITGISTMRCMSADVHQFARYIRTRWPEVKNLDQVRPEMAQAYIAELVERERSGGRIARVCASLRKLDAACRKAGIFPPDAPLLLPYRKQGGPGGYHSKPRPIPYSEDQAQAIIAFIEPQDPTVAKLLRWMWAGGLRVSEAAWLRTRDIDLEDGVIKLGQDGNANRTKGGRPRSPQPLPGQQEFFLTSKGSPDEPSTDHLFAERLGLPDQARSLVRQACRALNIPCLGTHGFRKTYSVADYQRARASGADDRQALLKTSHDLGHNRVDVTRQSYVPQEEREKDIPEDDR